MHNRKKFPIPRGYGLEFRFSVTGLDLIFMVTIYGEMVGQYAGRWIYNNEQVLVHHVRVRRLVKHSVNVHRAEDRLTTVKRHLRVVLWGDMGSVRYSFSIYNLEFRV
jgi:hypothetical protein